MSFRNDLRGKRWRRGDVCTAEIAEDAETNVNEITEQIIGPTIEVYDTLGPGLQ